MRASVRASSVLPQPVGPISRMFDLSISTSRAFVAERRAACSGCGRRRRAPSWRASWPIDVFVELRRRSRAAWGCGEELLGRAAAAPLLVEDRLAQLDALAADVNVAGSFDQRADVAIALATERTEGVLLRGTAHHDGLHSDPFLRAWSLLGGVCDRNSRFYCRRRQNRVPGAARRPGGETVSRPRASTRRVPVR